MAQYGLGNFTYTLEVKDGSATFHFLDPEDANNTADVTINQKDFPAEAPGADDRRVADIAYGLISEEMNATRDARVAKEKKDDIAATQQREKNERAAAQDFFDNSQDVATAPAKVEKDGTTVYNVADPKDNSRSEPAKTDDSKKK
jgi:hypothetical protein